MVSIGVFDGVHRGHRAILAANIARARSLDATPTVVTFSGHPKKLLLGRGPLTLTSLDHRLELFAEAGIEHTLVLDFNEDLRSKSAIDFVQRDLVEGLHARAFVLGFDSKFGRDREGTPERMRELGLDVEVVGAVGQGGRAVSSTAIREAVSLGDLDAAVRMLGRPVTVRGKVVHGNGRGAGIGFPTANLDLDHELVPPNGVYVTLITLLERRTESGQHPVLHSVTNIGLRPTIVGEPKAGSTPVVEVHVLDFHEDIYHERAALEFVQYLRPEQRFESIDALVEAIRKDVESARVRLQATE
ncbi:MAG: riboflavin kinase/FMN adenylyltransferase [Planctomycetota bacterium]